eukprot:gene641-236_t
MDLVARKLVSHVLANQPAMDLAAKKIVLPILEPLIFHPRVVQPLLRVLQPLACFLICWSCVALYFRIVHQLDLSPGGLLRDRQRGADDFHYSRFERLWNVFFTRYAFAEVNNGLTDPAYLFFFAVAAKELYEVAVWLPSHLPAVVHQNL